MGKTFAETNLKIVATYLTQSFDFEHVNERWRTEFPWAHFMQNKNVARMVRLTTRKQ